MSEQIKISSNKSFGIVFFVVFFLIGIYPILNNQEIRFWSIIISLIFLILGILNSKVLTPLNFAWFKLGLFLGSIISPIVMGIIFFLVVFPTGLVMRIFKKDILDQKINKSKNSYWKSKIDLNNSFKNQF